MPDYILGNGTAALYISLRYHLSQPEYLYVRMRELQRRRGAALATARSAPGGAVPRGLR